MSLVSVHTMAALSASPPPISPGARSEAHVSELLDAQGLQDMLDRLIMVEWVGQAEVAVGESEAPSITDDLA